MRAGKAGSLELISVGVAWCVCVLGLSMVALTIPVYTVASIQWLRVPESAGLSVGDTIRLTGLVRALVADQEYEPLPSSWRGRPAFDASAVSHLGDVRSVVAGARIATGFASIIIAVWIGFGVARRRWSALAGGLRSGGLLTLGMMTLAVAAALTDFNVFFAAFHGVFFRAGTWQFPSDAMLIRLFPERFWETAGAAWAILTAIGAGVLFLAARYVSRIASPSGQDVSIVTSDEEDGSRMAEDV